LCRIRVESARDALESREDFLSVIIKSGRGAREE
jgi:hypothetical protein